MKHFESTGSGKIVDKAMENSKKKFNTSVNPTCSADILLQTLVVYLYGNGGSFPVRALIDTRIQKSYITKEAVSKLSYEQIRAEDMIHNLFGGVETYDQETIFIDISKAISGPWTKEIEEKGIFLSDKEACLYDSTSSVHLLIGVDIADKQFTGKIGNLSCGLVAMETLLGWTVMGKSENEVKNDSYMTVLSLHVNNKSISDLWSLDTLGILDSADKQGKIEIEKETEKLVLNSVKQDGDGRYVVSLPWLEDHPVLPSNKSLAEKRLKNAVDRIKNLGILQDYENVFEDWKKEGIIEELNSENLKDSKCHYLPHRPVIKENSTTRIRPVSDGSEKSKRSPSLNDCLVTGSNLVELISSLINRFRIGKYGVIADICKAFL
ncbi:uncharacterized protein LOC129975591 [Argiope bruennichi]|uniref:uncharacterized protein LOC129975591 n=1 Tax=Argiope bruennichi TaxID=94029 RepID=UPI00249404CC|nr:uncharacterized protein LOC129975591 [Argiope bruennichi]